MNLLSQAGKRSVADVASATLIGSLTEKVLSNLQQYDIVTYWHSVNVSSLCTLIGTELALTVSELECLRISGLLHDTGKLSVPRAIIKKPGALETTEYEIAKGHVSAGRDLLTCLGADSQVVTIVGQHHERIDGSGYPAGLKCPEILLESKILAVADCLDAMAANRPYRISLGLQRSLDILNEDKGYKLDSTVVDAVSDLHKRGRLDSFLDNGVYAQ